MEKTLEKTLLIINENEKIMANILHDIKSPLYSIKIGLQNQLDRELHKDIFETVTDVINYVENFLVDYSFKTGKFQNKVSSCNIRKIINEKIENYKYIFINKNISIDFICNNESFIVNSIEIFISSIIGNIISNIAFHAQKNTTAQIEIYKKNSLINIDFKNYYNDDNNNFTLGLNFCDNLARYTKIDMKFCKTKNQAHVNLKIPNIKSYL